MEEPISVSEQKTVSIAIYARKSKITGKGESIQNQIIQCKQAAYRLYPGMDLQFSVFQDEGFSGKNTDRPQFQSMMRQVQSHAFSALVCYRLDRVSRNVAQFSKIIELLEQHQTQFISVCENFDTITPMGRAMMYLCSVFAQLERETTSERIQDNLTELAKTGRWLGGVSPLGYRSIEVKQKDLGRHCSYRLQKNQDAAVVEDIFCWYLQSQTLSQVIQLCNQAGYLTQNHRQFTPQALRYILKNPVYAQADEDTYRYFRDNGYTIYAKRDAFDGRYGVMAYQKTRQNGIKKQACTPEDWIISVGVHPYLVCSRDWIAVQKKFLSAKKQVRGQKWEALLKGKLFCAQCQSPMRSKKMSGRTDRWGRTAFYYLCSLKETTHRASCTIQNLNGNRADDAVIQCMEQQILEKNIGVQKKKVLLELCQESMQETLSMRTRTIVDMIKEEEKRYPSLGPYLQQLGEELRRLKLDQEEQIAGQKDMVDRLISWQRNSEIWYAPLSRESQMALVQSYVDTVKWDGRQLHLHFQK